MQVYFCFLESIAVKRKKGKSRGGRYDGLLVSQLLAERDKMNKEMSATGVSAGATMIPNNISQQQQVKVAYIPENPLQKYQEFLNQQAHHANDSLAVTANKTASKRKLREAFSPGRDPMEDLGPITCQIPPKLQFMEMSPGQMRQHQQYMMTQQMLPGHHQVSGQGGVPANNMLQYQPQQHMFAQQMAQPFQDQFSNKTVNMAGMLQSPPLQNVPSMQHQQQQHNVNLQPLANMNPNMAMTFTGAAPQMQPSPGAGGGGFVLRPGGPIMQQTGHQGAPPGALLQVHPGLMQQQEAGSNMLMFPPNMQPAMNNAAFGSQSAAMLVKSEKLAPPFPPMDAMWQESRQTAPTKKRTRKKKERRKYNSILDRASPCPNIDVRHISRDSRTSSSTTPPAPITTVASFLENPAAFLAQQTAIVNSSMPQKTSPNADGEDLCDNMNILRPSSTPRTTSTDTIVSGGGDADEAHRTKTPLSSLQSPVSDMSHPSTRLGSPPAGSAHSPVSVAVSMTTQSCPRTPASSTTSSTMSSSSPPTSREPDGPRPDAPLSTSTPQPPEQSMVAADVPGQSAMVTDASTVAVDSETKDSSVPPASSSATTVLGQPTSRVTTNANKNIHLIQALNEQRAFPTIASLRPRLSPKTKTRVRLNSQTQANAPHPNVRFPPHNPGGMYPGGGFPQHSLTQQPPAVGAADPRPPAMRHAQMSGNITPQQIFSQRSAGDFPASSLLSAAARAQSVHQTPAEQQQKQQPNQQPSLNPATQPQPQRSPYPPGFMPQKVMHQTTGGVNVMKQGAATDQGNPHTPQNAGMVGMNPQNPNMVGMNPQNPNMTGMNPQNPNMTGMNPQNPNMAAMNHQNPNMAGMNLQNQNMAGLNSQNPSSVTMNHQSPNMGPMNPGVGPWSQGTNVNTFMNPGPVVAPGNMMVNTGVMNPNMVNAGVGLHPQGIMHPEMNRVGMTGHPGGAGVPYMKQMNYENQMSNAFTLQPQQVPASSQQSPQMAPPPTHKKAQQQQLVQQIQQSVQQIQRLNMHQHAQHQPQHAQHQPQHAQHGMQPQHVQHSMQPQHGMQTQQGMQPQHVQHGLQPQHQMQMQQQQHQTVQQIQQHLQQHQHMQQQQQIQMQQLHPHQGALSRQPSPQLIQAQQYMADMQPPGMQQAVPGDPGQLQGSAPITMTTSQHQPHVHQNPRPAAPQTDGQAYQSQGVAFHAPTANPNIRHQSLQQQQQQQHQQQQQQKMAQQNRHLHPAQPLHLAQHPHKPLGPHPGPPPHPGQQHMQQFLQAQQLQMQQQLAMQPHSCPPPPPPGSSHRGVSRPPRTSTASSTSSSTHEMRLHTMKIEPGEPQATVTTTAPASAGDAVMLDRPQQAVQPEMRAGPEAVNHEMRAGPDAVNHEMRAGPDAVNHEMRAGPPEDHVNQTTKQEDGSQQVG